ncbi:uncharacterized protein LOC132305519 [Cornus florida]|uniref:uncharacterized protein LOC132305519 n=1 Tax=Cornus florida TaxID=4283 RepID=UPI00289A62AF|nr:uncharacterized protein LOC132305519 [Cornus florida]
MYCSHTNTGTITTSAAKHHSTVAPRVSANRNLSTSFYQTDFGLFALTWSRHRFSHSLHLQLLLKSPSAADTHRNENFSNPSFHLHIKPFIFWNKHGSQKMNFKSTTTNSIQIFWDLTSAKFGSRPDPLSGFYIAVVVNGEMVLLVGDSLDKAYSKTTAAKPRRGQAMVLRREHVHGNKVHTTKASFGGKTRDISIDCRVGDDPSLCFSVDNKRVLQVNHLKWKFRGNGMIEVDGVRIQVSWDVYNWLFKDHGDQDGYALFMFRFEKLGFEDEMLPHLNDQKNGMLLLSQESCEFGIEKKKKKSFLKTAKISSSSESPGCSSVMQWESMEENKLKGPSEFSLMVYARKS